MAKRRMFSPDVVNSDAFMTMPLSTQALYFHLGMVADDDGFIGNPRMIQRMCGALEDDLNLLLAKRFLLDMGDGVVIIKHWKMNNLVKKDRYKPSSYAEKLGLLKVKGNGSYTFAETPALTCGGTQAEPVWNPNGTLMEPQDRIGKVINGLDKSKPLSGKPDESASSDVSTVISYLNEKTGRRYRASGKNAQLVSARLNEGYSVDDCKRVVDVKVADWGLDTHWSKYLRPETLFCKTHFDGYLNEASKGVASNEFSEWDDVSQPVAFGE